MLNHLNFAPIFKGFRLITGLVSISLLVFSGVTNAASTTFLSTAAGTQWTAPTSANIYTPDTGSSGQYWAYDHTKSAYQESLVFQSYANSVSTTPNDPFALGLLTHDNLSSIGTGNITSANLNLQLSLKEPSTANYSVFNFQYIFGISQGPYTNPTTGATYNANTLTFSPIGSTQFNLGEQAYSFELLGFYDASNSNTYSTLIVGNTLTASQIPLYAKITAVPVPAALWLLGSGLLGLAGFAKRKHAA